MAHVQDGQAVRVNQAAPPDRHRRRMIGIVGLVLTALFLVGLDTRPMVAENTPTKSAENPAADDFQASADNYRQAIDRLEKVIAAARRKLDPELEKVFSRNLYIIDGSIKDCCKALEKDPGNVETQNYLLTSYRKKVELLQQKYQLLNDLNTWGRFFYRLWKL